MIYIIIPPYALLALYIILKLVKNQKTEKRKIILGLFFTFLFFLPLTWDVILGRAYFYYLCSTQGGMHVYKTVELESKYFDKNGIPMFYNRNKRFDDMSVAGRFVGKIRGKVIFDILNIKKRTRSVIDTSSGEVLGDFTYYIYFGGWFINASGFPVNGVICPSSEKPSSYIERLSENIFLKSDKS